MKLCVCGHSIIAHDNCEECLEDECECDSYEPRGKIHPHHEGKEEEEMRTITMLTVSLLLCGNAWAEECYPKFSKVFKNEEFERCKIKQMDSIAKALEEIARKMPEPPSPTAPQPLESTWNQTDTKE